MTAHSRKRSTQNLRLIFLGVVLVFLLGSYHPAYCQEKPIISVGVGLPELANIGIRIPRDQIQIGVSVGGIFLVEDFTAFSFSTDFRYYFGGSTILLDELPWYWEIGFNFLKSEDKYTINEYAFLNTRIGFEVNLTKKLGAEVDFGGLLELHHLETKKSHLNNWDFDIIDFPVLPSFSASIFYRL